MNAYGIAIIIILLTMAKYENTYADDISNYIRMYSKISNNSGPTSSLLINFMLNEVKTNFTNKDITVQNRCYDELNEFKEGLQNDMEWALRMLDASSQLQSGFLEGNLVNYGHYKECISVNNSNITGAFCSVLLVDMMTPEIETKPRAYRIYDQYHVEMQVCIPSGCDKDMENILKNGLEEDGIAVVVTQCTTSKKMKGPDKAQLFVLYTFATAAILVVAATVFHVVLKNYFKEVFIKHSKPLNIILSFSLGVNGNRLFKTDKNEKSIKCIHGLRFISAVAILVIHRNVGDRQPATNLFQVDKDIRTWYGVILINAYIFVDTFFLISGLLISYTLLQSGARKNDINPAHMYVHRYIRLTPPLVAVIMLDIILSLFCNSITCEYYDQSYCRNSWYFVIAYISNLVDQARWCLGHVWYLSADMQMFVFAPILMYIAIIWPRTIFYVLSCLVGMNTLATFGISYYYKLKSSYIQTQEELKSESDHVYTQFYTRIGPWLIGFGLGIVLDQQNRNPFKMKKLFVILGWLAAAICCFAAFFGLYPFIQIDFVHTLFKDSLYKALHRNVWAFGCAWIIYACFTGNGGLLNRFLSSPAFHPLSKLSYCLYLVHPLVQKLQYTTINEPRTYTGMSQVSLYVGDVFYSVLLAMVLHLLFEAPTLNLEKTFRSRKIAENEIPDKTTEMSNIVHKVEEPTQPQKINGVVSNSIHTIEETTQPQTTSDCTPVNSQTQV